MTDLGRSVRHVIFHKRYGNLTWDAILRCSGALALLAIPVTLYEPQAAALTGFVLITVWINGPLSPLLPATYEPILMLLGRVYPPVLVAALGTGGILGVEYVNYQLYRQVLFTARLRRLHEGRLVRRIVNGFQRAPFLTVWVVSLTPLPYWAVRFLSPLAGYPVERQLLATLLGRFPRLWFFAALGAYWGIDTAGLFAISGISIVLGLVAWTFRLRRHRGRMTRSDGVGEEPSERSSSSP